MTNEVRSCGNKIESSRSIRMVQIVLTDDRAQVFAENIRFAAQCPLSYIAAVTNAVGCSHTASLGCKILVCSCVGTSRPQGHTATNEVRSA